MVSLLLKRLLLAIPVLWLIATIIFMLSKLMPGTFGSQQLSQAEVGYYTKANADSRDRAYQQYLRATGQDLPLFYFSITSSANPDTLYRIFPERDRQLVERWSLLYGQPTAATQFYRSLRTLERNADDQLRKQLQPYLYALYRHSRRSELEEAVQNISRVAPTSLIEQSQLVAHARALTANPSPYAYLLPRFVWHGTSNQYHRWLGSLAKGSLGISLRDGRPVAAVLLEAVGNTWWLLIGSMVLATLLSLEMALLMVRRSGRKWRRFLLPSLFLLDSVPLFVLAMLLLVVLANPAFLQLFPVYGMGYSASPQNWWQASSQWLQYMALPMLSLVLANLPYLTNQFYQGVVAVSEQDYIRTARAKGLSESRVIRKHMLRNALLPVITLLSDFLPALVAGAVIIETIFAIPGIGRLLIEAVMARDYPVLVGIVVLIAVFRLLAHLLSDLLYALADPRIRHATT
jgi:peptide/nickel transport system permease protein